MLPPKARTGFCPDDRPASSGYLATVFSDWLQFRLPLAPLRGGFLFMGSENKKGLLSQQAYFALRLGLEPRTL